MTPTQEHPRLPPPVRPRISITVPPAYMLPPQQQLNSAQYSPAHYFQQFQQPVGVIPTTPGSRISVTQDPNQPQGPPDYPDYYSMYPAKAGEFMFKQFEGFRDFTYNTAKSGLGVGEKSVFWLYTKITKWSRNWFTHIFLFLMLFLYSVAGAALFIAVEGTHEKKMETNVNHAKKILAKNLRILALDREKLENADPDLWEGRAINLVEEYSAVLYESYKQASFENKQNKKTWSFWNAVFYCGTIYTTIAPNRKPTIQAMVAKFPILRCANVVNASNATNRNESKTLVKPTLETPMRPLTYRRTCLASTKNGASSSWRSSSSCRKSESWIG
uniref:Putative twik family of potassium channels protein 18 isoform x3 n=1 Tax=Culex tarsalis TaxID=7177 RepID=A0A1Q3EYT4_CULTA